MSLDIAELEDDEFEADLETEDWDEDSEEEGF